jgi:hypothetical protein
MVVRERSDHMKPTHLLGTATLALSVSFMTGCGGDAASDPVVAGPVTNQDIVHVPFFIHDASGQAPTDPATQLYEARKGNPITAPDGHQVTLAEFNAVTGTATASCTAAGTKAELALHGLIPNAVYTGWNLVFKAPGFDPTFANLTGLGAAGSPDGSQNIFRSSAAGDATLSAITPAGSLSMMGSIMGCALTEEFEWHVVGAYHIDGQSHGPQMGPDGTAVEQFGFMFKR